MADALAADAAAVDTAREQILPPLREDIQLMQGPPTRDGAPTWTLYDPALHRYLRIGRLEFMILCLWKLRRPEAIASAVSSATTYNATPADVIDVLRFADRANLLLLSGPEATRRLSDRAAAHKISAAQWLLKNYLFLRIRLVDPDHFLGVMLSLLGWVYSKTFVAGILGLGALGFFLIGQQWDSYKHSFLHLFTLQGAFLVGTALAFGKAVHEFGHGLTAKRFGCRVPGMGVALMVLWPMLWTDCTNAWRLTDPRQRLLIDAAGMLAEVVLAVFASLLWSSLPDGSLRTACFLLSSSTWLITIAININPLMRFDGYYLFGDWLGEPNLQERAFALGRWWVRELLFGLGDPPPEHFALGRRRILFAYAIASWIYRFGLFLGIALVVYHLTFKLLGIFLMLVEIGWFLARPIWNELRVWHQRVPAAGWTWRSAVTGVIVVTALVVFVTPWRGNISAPALLRSARQTTLFTAEAGQLVGVTDNATRVTQGQPLFVMQSPDIAHDHAAAMSDLVGLQAQLAGMSFDPNETDGMQVAFGKLAQAVANLRTTEAQMGLETVRAPFAGELVDVPRGLRPGVWLPRREPLGELIEVGPRVVEADVSEADVGRVHPGASALFLPENDTATMRLIVRSVSPAAITSIDSPALASVFGGGVAARRTKDHGLVPEGAVYRVMLDVVDQRPDATGEVRRGWVSISGDRASLLARIWRRAVALVVRESGP